jgi:ABC-type multidrug transport system fused ATPase/permease subunit
MLIFLFFSFLFDSQGSIINSCVCALLGLSIAFTVSWRLSLALLGALPLLGAAEGAQQTLMISGEKNIGKALNASAEIVNESVKSAKEIQAFGLQSVVSRHLL